MGERTRLLKTQVSALILGQEEAADVQAGRGHGTSDMGMDTRERKKMRIQWGLGVWRATRVVQWDWGHPGCKR